MNLRRKLPCFAVLFLANLTGCFYVPGSLRYAGPPERPQAELEQYYSKGRGVLGFGEFQLAHEYGITVKTINIETEHGPVTVTYYQRDEPSDSLVFVFPVLGGKNIFENYFAFYFARYGFDSAIVHRNGEFKDPNRIDEIEELFRKNVIRDRIAIDFFEQNYGKKRFATFGLSRGAINVTMTAGVDARLKHNMLVMGGTDLVGIFKSSREKGVIKFRNAAMLKRKLNDEQFYAMLRKNIRTEPKTLAQYLDARNTLMVLAMFDRAVPIRFGKRLRRQIGYPDTIYLPTTHVTSLLYTQFVRLVPPVPAGSPFALFPVDYIETEALRFFNRAFETGNTSFEQILFRVLQWPTWGVTRLGQVLGAQ